MRRRLCPYFWRYPGLPYYLPLKIRHCPFLFFLTELAVYGNLERTRVPSIEVPPFQVHVYGFRDINGVVHPLDDTEHRAVQDGNFIIGLRGGNILIPYVDGGRFVKIDIRRVHDKIVVTEDDPLYDRYYQPIDFTRVQIINAQ